jgi:hypothetical protein
MAQRHIPEENSLLLKFKKCYEFEKCDLNNEGDLQDVWG